MSIPPSQYPQKFKEDIFVNFCHNNSSPYEEVQHFHEYHYEFCFILKGSAEYYFDFEQYTISNKNVIFLDKKMPHLSLESTDEACERIVINFNDNYLKSLSLDYYFLTEIFKTPIFDIPYDYKDSFRQMLTDLVYESDYPSNFSANLISGTFYRLLVTMYRIATNTQIKKLLPTNPIIEMATKYIWNNFSSDITLDSVAEVCHINKYYLSKLFKSIKNETFISYLNSIRVQNASDLLINTDKSISEISQICGFNSQNHFCEVFKSKKGVSARDFRKFK